MLAENVRALPRVQAERDGPFVSGVRSLAKHEAGMDDGVATNIRALPTLDHQHAEVSDSCVRAEPMSGATTGVVTEGILRDIPTRKHGSDAAEPCKMRFDSETRTLVAATVAELKRRLQLQQSAACDEQKQATCFEAEINPMDTAGEYLLKPLVPTHGFKLGARYKFSASKPMPTEERLHNDALIPWCALKVKKRMHWWPGMRLG